MNKGLETILLRNAFYRDNYKRAVLVTLLLFAVNCVLLWGIFYKMTHPPKPQYFAATADGRILNTHPLSDPVVTDNFVVQWTAKQVRAAFSQDYLHWREQLQDVSGSFTPDGWRYFLESMKKSNNLNTLVSKKMVANAEITSAPEIVQKAIVSGHFAWKIKMPILVTYTNGRDTIPLPLDVTVIVLRVPVQDYPQRIAINNFLPVPRSTGLQQSEY